MTALETRFDTILPTLATKSDVEGLRADLHKMSADIKAWTFATIITIIGTMAAAVFGVSQIYKGAIPIVPAAQPAPIVVIVPSTITSAAPSSPK